MLIRTEAPADILAIDRLLKKTFPTNREADLVMQLRENSNLTLSLVACNEEGDLVGHIMFSPVSVDGEFGYWQGLGPISVASDYLGQGIASRLVTQGLEFLCDFSYPVCVVLGDPNFYGKLGFKDASLYGLRCNRDIESGSFQVIDIYDGALQGVSGVVHYSPEFSNL